jgi:hypothetical protein
MDPRQTYLRFLAEDIEQNLERFDERTGCFLTGDGWAVTNQDLVYPLALLFKTKSPNNPYHGETRLLEYALRGADAWRDFQYPDGKVEFVKVDGSKWGPIYMPWSMYHWLETYALLADLLDAPRKARWEEGLRLAYEGIAAELETARVHNIPTWNGMALYRAGQILDRPTWQERGRATIDRAVTEQTPQGYWREHHGPTTSYNLVYTHAIGLYHFFSGDESALPCLRRATDFAIRYSYPDGRVVETIDGRVKYHDRVSDLGHATLSLFPDGRRYVRLLVEQMGALRQTRSRPHISYVKRSGSLRIASAEYGLSARLASAYQHYQPGPESPIPEDERPYRFHDPDHALFCRKHGWFTCLSGVVTPVVDSRWGQDRQNYVSVWHERTGLIVGGGNSKNQPEWSTCSVGEGEELVYLPSAAALHQGAKTDAVSLTYAGVVCTLEIEVLSERRLQIGMAIESPASVSAPAKGHLVFRLRQGGELRTSAGERFTVGETRIEVNGGAAGTWVAHNGWQVYLPEGSQFLWPVLPFNPYAADDAAPLEDAAAILTVPLGGRQATVLLEVSVA